MAAVDAHVGLHLFENCITPLVKANKCVVLVTNALQFIRDADEILVLDNGSIIEHGTFADLLLMRGSFHDMMMAHAEGMATADDARGREIVAEDPLVLVDLELDKARTTSVDSMKSLPAPKQESTAAKAPVEVSKIPKGQLIANEDREVIICPAICSHCDRLAVCP